MHNPFLIEQTQIVLTWYSTTISELRDWQDNPPNDGLNHDMLKPVVSQYGIISRALSRSSWCHLPSWEPITCLPISTPLLPGSTFQMQPVIFFETVTCLHIKFFHSSSHGDPILPAPSPPGWLFPHCHTIFLWAPQLCPALSQLRTPLAYKACVSCSVPLPSTVYFLRDITSYSPHPQKLSSWSLFSVHQICTVCLQGAVAFNLLPLITQHCDCKRLKDTARLKAWQREFLIYLKKTAFLIQN